MGISILFVAMFATTEQTRAAMLTTTKQTRTTSCTRCNLILVFLYYHTDGLDWQPLSRTIQGLIRQYVLLIKILLYTLIEKEVQDKQDYEYHVLNDIGKADLVDGKELT